MKKILMLPAFLLFLFSSVYLNAQITASSQWTWVNGDNTINTSGVYGTQGVAAATNKPGARDGGASWTDAAGNFWLFGGSGIAAGSNGLLNDLWKYNPSTNQWTWINGTNTTNQPGNYGTIGTPAATNKPGGRWESVSWTDAAGNFWLFGGYGYATSSTISLLNDLWKYNPSTNQWTWVNGSNMLNMSAVYGTLGTAAPSNQPGARAYSVAWADASGNLWLFGGGAIDYDHEYFATLPLNDLWKYNPSTNQWTWINGDNTPSQPGNYGTMGTPAVANKPGARERSTARTDAAGNLWLFGGSGYTTGNIGGILNDLWKYNPSTNQWTWINGDNTPNQPGNYGIMGTPAVANKPGGRWESVSWTDASDNFWLSGGHGYAANSYGVLNDLWKYSPSVNQWTWINGANTLNQQGLYGTMGVPASANRPGARYRGTSWTDAPGNLWLFGGGGYASNGSGSLNDLWKLGNTSVSFLSINDGNWGNSSTWAGGVVPSASSTVTVRHNVTVQANAGCYSLRIEGPSGNVTVATGVQFIVLH